MIKGDVLSDVSNDVAIIAKVIGCITIASFVISANISQTALKCCLYFPEKITHKGARWLRNLCATLESAG